MFPFNSTSERSEREGEAHLALPNEGATRAPVKQLKGVLQESAARFAIAVGLAMREIK